MEIKDFDVKKVERVIGEEVQSVEHISYGYTNKIYSINNKYVLKICVNEHNFKNFKRASEFCQRYYGQINCPQIIYSNLDMENGDLWQIEEKVQGENLFFKWTSLSEDERILVIDKICDALRQVHKIPVLDVFDKNFESDDWKNKFKKDIEKNIVSLREKGIVYDKLFYDISGYLNRHLDSLNQTDYRVCHSDMHFDNVMIDENNNVVILDYDRLRISSRDYELNIFNVMSKTPEIIANKEAKEKLNIEDYKNVLALFEERYKELANFPQMEERLNIYAIKHYLGLFKFLDDKERADVVNLLEDIVTERKVKEEKDSDNERE